MVDEEEFWRLFRQTAEELGIEDDVLTVEERPEDLGEIEALSESDGDLETTDERVARIEDLIADALYNPKLNLEIEYEITAVKDNGEYETFREGVLKGKKEYEIVTTDNLDIGRSRRDCIYLVPILVPGKARYVRPTEGGFSIKYDRDGNVKINKPAGIELRMYKVAGSMEMFERNRRHSRSAEINLGTCSDHGDKYMLCIGKADTSEGEKDAFKLYVTLRLKE